MTAQPYAVFDGSKTIVAAFSNEDLAQVHAAKLRALLPERPSLLGTYTVGPLELDAEVGLEIEYCASMEVVLSKLAQYSEDDIELETSNELTRTLQVGIVDLYRTVSPKSDHEALHIAFDAYGWSPEQAIATLHAMVAEYLANPDPQESLK